MDVVLTKENEVLVCHDLCSIRILLATKAVSSWPRARRPWRSARGRAPRIRAEVRRPGPDLDELARFGVGRLNPDSAYSRFFPDQFPVDGTRMPTLREVVRLAVKATGRRSFPDRDEDQSCASRLQPATRGLCRGHVQGAQGRRHRRSVEVHAFDFRCLYELQKLDKRVKTAYLTSRDNEQGERTASSPRTRRPPAFDGGQAREGLRSSIPAMVKPWADTPGTRRTPSSPRSRWTRPTAGLKVVVWSWPEKLGTGLRCKAVGKDD